MTDIFMVSLVGRVSSQKHWSTSELPCGLP